jgi:hypothetical protein
MEKSCLVVYRRLISCSFIQYVPFETLQHAFLILGLELLSPLILRTDNNMSETEQENQSVYEQYMNQVIDIEDEVFENNSGIPPPPDKKRSSVMAFVDDLDAGISTADALKKKKRDVLGHIDANNNANLLMQILQNLSDFQQEQRAFNVESRRRHEFFTIVSENRILRSMGMEAMDVPFLRPSIIPPNTELPFIRSAEEIEELNLQQIRLYLEAYDIRFNDMLSRRRLKDLLRIKLGFTSLSDLAINMS